ncbi:MAG: hypothetical protein HYW49_09650, partial [Deltaproteobacteria bacterium]|nr:hypothetical protein [Deltaproteobacteria bacterium]
MICLGATGGGKTTLQIIMALHAVRHRQPSLIIDPKGEDSTLRLIQRIGRGLADDFDERFKVFRMSKPSESCQYNPLKHGNSIQLKDRILEALNWSEQYYQSVAGDFLTVLTACTEHLGMPLTLELISNLVGRLRQNEILVKLVEKMNQGDTKAKDLHSRLNVLTAKVKQEDLAGLQAQLSILNNPYIGHLLSFSESQNEIDLRDV